jgi:D-3-phosphoglycerate dehydrogenase / 2-oxoglutarate reductase
MIGEEAIGQMKRGVIILNLARDPLADEKAVLAGLKSGVIRKYVTDFATPALLQAENTIVIPHLGASTEESEDNCAVMAVNELKEYLENGSIRNSVNYPTCEVGVCQSAGRIAINHKNVPNMIAQFTKVLADEGMNITDFANKSRGDYAYSVIDTSVSAGDHVKKALEAIDGVLRVRIVK